MDGSWTQLIDRTNSPSINQGIGTNHLRVDRIGADIHVYLNGTQVTMFTDSNFISAGRDAGVRAYSYKNYPVYMRFDNFSVHRIP